MTDQPRPGLAQAIANDIEARRKAAEAQRTAAAAPQEQEGGTDDAA